MFRIESEQGQWLTDMALNVHPWKAGDTIYWQAARVEVIQQEQMQKLEDHPVEDRVVEKPVEETNVEPV